VNVLVTGGLGFLGAAIVKRLVAGGDAVRVLDNASRGKLGAVAADVELHEGDIRDPAVVARAVAGVEAVYHLAYVNGTRFFYERPREVLDVAVRGMLNVLDASSAAGVRALYVASSSEVYQTPPRVPTDERVPLSIPDVLNPRYSYGGGKILWELLALYHGRELFERVVIFRPHNVYGPDMGREHVIPELIEKLRRRPRTLQLQGDGSDTRSFVFIDDCVEGVLLATTRGEHLGIYNVGTMDEIVIAELARKIAARLGLEVTLVAGPPAPGGTPRRCPDIGKLAALGYAPRVSLDEGLAVTVDWYRDHP
jgi:UDP-glucose 4-epimerase